MKSSAALMLKLFAFLPAFILADDVHFFFDANELHSVQYGIRIAGEPIVSGGEEEGLHQNQVTMMNKYGQKYLCLLPDVPAENGKKDSEVTMETGPSSDEESEDDSATLSTQNVRRLLEPLTSEPCIVFTKDWWSYEFCYGKEIRQYHMEDLKPSGAITNLGEFSHDFDWSVAETGDEKKNVSKITFHSQFYTNGTLCDLTGELRRTEVRFECNPEDVASSILRVDEPQSCEYVITVSTDKLCTIPDFQPKQVPKPKEINCSPVFTEPEYEKWLKFKAIEKDRAEKRRKEALELQKKEMLEMFKAEDVSSIDTETDEGMSKLEGMVGDKMAEKLMRALNEIFGVKETAEDTEELEMELPSGEKKTLWRPDGQPKAQFAGKKGERGEKELEEKHLNLKLKRKLFFQMAEDVLKLLKVVAKQGEAATYDRRLINALGSNLQGFRKLLERMLKDDEGVAHEELDLGDLKNRVETTLDQVTKELELAEAEIDGAEGELETEQSKHGEKESLPEEKDGVATNGSEEEPKPRSSSEDMIRITNVATDEKEGVQSTNRIVKQMESAVKQKLSKVALDTGGRKIEIKILTADGEHDASLIEAFNSKRHDRRDEQLQGMVYNLIIGDKAAYTDLSEQSKSEVNYKLSMDHLEKRFGDSDSVLDEGASSADETSSSSPQREEIDDGSQEKLESAAPDGDVLPSATGQPVEEPVVEQLP